MTNKKQQHFLTLYKPIHDRFERFCRARVYGDMEYQDLMNETLLIAYQKLESLRSEKNFLSFLFSISVRVLSNSNKKKKPQRLPKEQNAQAFLDPSSKTDINTEITLLHEALAMLPDTQREAIILFEISGFSIKEITAIQNASLSAVKQRLKRGRERLIEILSFESEHKMGELNYEK